MSLTVMHKFTNGPFNKMLEKATSNYLLETDWETILSICDLIRQGDVQPKYAVQSIHKKIMSDNPHTALYALLVLECCVKNCGTPIHDEVCTKQYMEQLKEAVKTTQQDVVKNKILEIIQAWAHAFRDSSKYRAVQDTLRIMKAENFEFPALKESDAMFDASIAPEWVDGSECHRCRQPFSAFNRKHHCRACGQVFCAQCSNKNSTLPKYGIEKEVRVCSTCYDYLNKPSVAPAKETDLPAHYLNSSLAQQQQVPPKKSEDELREEEELQIALALSQSEAEHKEQEKKRATSAFILNSAAFSKDPYSPPPSPEPSPSSKDEEEVEEVDPELAKYLNRQYWEQRQSALEEQTSRISVTSPSAPNIGSPMPQKLISIKQQNGEVDNEMESFVKKLRGQVEIFVNRMKSNSSRGRSIANDSSVQNLFMKITAMHSELLRYIRNQEDKRVYYEGLQDKLTQIKDGRGALDALREEHREKLLKEKLEADRKKQLQMAEKLEIMRKKKQEYFEYQRQLALSKVQEEKRELQMRQEIQKQQYNMGGYQSVSGYVGAMANQGSPVRHSQYIAEYNNSMSPTNQAVYGYPHGTAMAGQYTPAYMMHHHHHQPQQQLTPMQQHQIHDMTITTIAENPALDPTIVQNHMKTETTQESLGQVTVSGPGMVPQMSGMGSQPAMPNANVNLMMVSPEVVTSMQHGLPPHAMHTQTLMQVPGMIQMQGSISEKMLAAQQQMMQIGHQGPASLPQPLGIPTSHQQIQIPGQQPQVSIQSRQNHQVPISGQQTHQVPLPGQQTQQIHIANQPNQQIQIAGQQIHSMQIPNQASHQIHIPCSQTHQIQVPGQVPQNQVQLPGQGMPQTNLGLGVNVTAPGQITMPSQVTSAHIAGVSQIQGLSDINMSALHASQGIPQSQDMQYQPQIQQPSTQQSQPQTIQVVQVQAPPQPPAEEERKTPEVAELISFD